MNINYNKNDNAVFITIEKIKNSFIIKDYTRSGYEYYKYCGKEKDKNYEEIPLYSNIAYTSNELYIKILNLYSIPYTIITILTEKGYKKNPGIIIDIINGNYNTIEYGCFYPVVYDFDDIDLIDGIVEGYARMKDEIIKERDETE